MNYLTPKPLDELQLSDFLRTSADSGTLITDIHTPNGLTPLRQIHEAAKVVIKEAQLEIAWQNNDDDTVRDIIRLM